MFIWDWISQDYWPQLIDSFVNPQKRVSVGYLLAAIVIALVWSGWTSRRAWRAGLAQGVRNLFGREALLSASARADYKVLLVNRAVMMLIAPAMLSKFAVTTFLYFSLMEAFAGHAASFGGAPVWLSSATFTLFLFTFDDFSRFAVHRALHRVPLLWAFHKTHHTAETLNPFTVYRTHPVEGVLYTLRGALVQGIAVSLFVFLFGESLDLVSLYGVNILMFLFNATGSNLRHSLVQIRYGRRLEHVLMSPAQHQLHHSVAACHHDTNFGAAIALWDWMFGSLCLSEKDMKLRFGLADGAPTVPHGLTGLYLAPFADAFRSTRRAAATGVSTAGKFIRTKRFSRPYVG
jgi:sterol desaturase/sphingolipid hydroxylase (fatty acid hydroxylase superfamily)